MGGAGSNVPAIILGSGITALGVQRVLGRSGVVSYLATPDERLNRRSRWFRPVPGGEGAPSEGGLAEWLDGIPVSRAVLFPCSDAWALAVSSLDRDRRSRFPACVADREVIQTLTDKGRFAATLEALEIPHPWSAILEREDDLETLPAERFQRLFLKPRGSQAFHADFGRKGFMARSLEEARGLLRRVNARGHSVIAQEYIPGPATSHYFVDGFVDQEGRISAFFARRRLRMHPPLFGNSTYMRSVPLREAEGAVQSLRTLLTSLGYRGVFSAEFKRDPRDGMFKILEVNARPWWYVDFAAKAGVNVCAMAYRDALGFEVPDIDDYEVGRTLVYPYSDWLACRRLVRSGELSLRSWIGSWFGADQPIFDRGDPWPAIAGGVDILLGWIRNRLGSERRASPAPSPDGS